VLECVHWPVVVDGEFGVLRAIFVSFSSGCADDRSRRLRSERGCDNATEAFEKAMKRLKSLVLPCVAAALL